MARMAHPDALQPSKPGSTRTAPAAMPDKFPAGGRYLSYMLFGATSIFYLVVALLILQMTWSLGSGPEAWERTMASFAHPLYLAWHVLAFGVFVWAGWRFLIKLSAKANPPTIGPLRRPPLAAFPPMMGALWVGATAVAVVVLWGIFP